MSTKDAIRNIFLRSIPLTPIDNKVLETLVAMKSGSAYSIRKVSGLKHYPTVLRSLKKLEKKGCVEALTELSGARTKRIYVPTLLGKLTHHILRRETAQVTKTIALSSPLFQAMVNAEVQGIDEWAYFIARYMLFHVDEEKPPNIGDILKDIVSGSLGDDVVNIHDQRSRNKILQITKVEWIRKLAIEETESEIRRSKKYIEQLRILKEKLTEEKA